MIEEPHTRLRAKVKGLLREPLLHFLIIGAGLFLLYGVRGGPAPYSDRQPDSQTAQIIVKQRDIEELVEQFAKTWQRPPAASEVAGLIEDFIRNEIYYREAQAIGLASNDSVIRRRMRQKMEFILEDIAALEEPSDEELRAYMQKYPERYRVDPQFSFRHVYFADQHGRDSEAEADAALIRLENGADPAQKGDSFLLGSDIPAAPLWEIRNMFGDTFGEYLLELEPGIWAGPIRSGYGVHLVLVLGHMPGRMPVLAEVRDQVRLDWAREKQQELKDAAYAKLRERYRITVDMPERLGAISVETAANTR